MIILLTGTPGAGKSLRAVQIAEEYLEQGRAVFTDIEGYSRCPPIPGGDWRQCGDGSVVIYDEAHRHDPNLKGHDAAFPARGKAGPAPELVGALSTHRHTGHDIVFVCQHPNQIDHDIRRLVGRHDHVKRIGSMRRSALITSDSLISLPEGIQSQDAAKNLWKFPKHYYSYYKSASVHLIQRRIPQPVLFLLFVLVLFLLLVGYVSTQLFFSKDDDDSLDSSLSSSPSSPSSPYSPPSLSPARADNSSQQDSAPLYLEPYHVPKHRGELSAPTVAAHIEYASIKPAPTVAGCISLKGACQCWNLAGQPLFLDLPVCLALLDSAVSYPRALSFSSRERARPPAAGALD